MLDVCLESLSEFKNCMGLEADEIVVPRRRVDSHFFDTWENICVRTWRVNSHEISTKISSKPPSIIWLLFGDTKGFCINGWFFSVGILQAWAYYRISTVGWTYGYSYQNTTYPAVRNSRPSFHEKPLLGHQNLFRRFDCCLEIPSDSVFKVWFRRWGILRAWAYYKVRVRFSKYYIPGSQKFLAFVERNLCWDLLSICGKIKRLYNRLLDFFTSGDCFAGS